MVFVGERLEASRGYGTVESGVVPPAAYSTRRVQVYTTLAALCALVVVVVLTTTSSQSGELLQKERGLTALQDRQDINSFFSQLTSSESAADKKAAKAADQFKNTAQSRSDLDQYFDALPTAKHLKHGLSTAEANGQLDYIFPTHEKKVAKKEQADQQHLKMLALTGAKAQNDLDSYFDGLPKPTNAQVKHAATRMTAEEAEKQLDSIFHTDETKETQKEEHQDGKDQSLAMSSAKAQDDLDSYFDNMSEGTTSSTSHAKDQSESTRKYIEAKRKAMKDHGSFTEVTNDGSVVKASDKWSSDGARKELDNYFGGEQQHMKAVDTNHQKKTSMNTMFQKQLEMAHREWMKAHKGPPKTEQEKQEYHKLLASENPADDDPHHKIIQAYLEQHPEVKANFDKVHNTWYANHGKPPATPAEQQEYKDLVVKYIGHLDINSKDVVKKVKGSNAADLKEAADTAAEEAKEKKAKKLHEYTKAHPEIKAKLAKVHADWMKTHKNPPTTAAEKKQYKEMMTKVVGKLDLTSSKKQVQMSSLTTHTDEEIEHAKQAALLDFENKHKNDITKKIAKVHKIWANTHKAPPQNEAEENEYDKLMEKFVGHPDVSEFFDYHGKKDAKKKEEDSLDDLDSNLLG